MKLYTLLSQAGIRGVFLGAVLSLLGTSAQASPVTYTGFTVTDGKLGSWEFHNARVYLTFKGDTSTVQFLQPPIDPTNPNSKTIDLYFNPTGTATVTIVTPDRTQHATFAPGQVFVSLDLGDTIDAPHYGGRGVGFGSFTPSGGIEPAYPLGIEDGTIRWGFIYDFVGHPVPSTEVTQLSTDLMHRTRFSGRAWSCVGFPSDCTAANPLITDKGALYLSERYFDGSVASAHTGDSLSAGFFLAEVGKTNSSVPTLAFESAKPSAKPITYNGYVISDVVLGTHRYSGAQVYLSFAADASTAVPFDNGSSFGYKNTTGDAHVTIVSKQGTVSAAFDPGQIYVYYDVGNASVGFGSTAVSSGYPLSITAKSNTSFAADVLDKNSSVGAVSDLTQNSLDASLYSPFTATLATDLTNATTLSGAASSCVAFDPGTSYCSNLAPTKLKTNRGDFYLYELYTVDEVGDGSAVFSINWGVFWADLGSRHGDD
jgi:hypothetical protein